MSNPSLASINTFSHLLQLMFDAVIAVDSEQRVIVFDEGAEAITGYLRQDVIGKPLDHLIPGHHSARHAQLAEAFTKDGPQTAKMGSRIVQIRCQDGSEQNIEILLNRVLFPTASGESKVITYAYIKNIGDLHANSGKHFSGQLRQFAIDAASAYESLQAMQNRLTHLLGATNIVLYTFEPSDDYRIRFVSDNVEATLGYTAEEFSAAGFWQNNVHPDDLYFVYNSFRNVFKHNTHHIEYRFRHGDGTWRWFRDTLCLLAAADGSPLEVVGCMMDITEHKRLADSLREKNSHLENAHRIEQQLKRYEAIVQSSKDAIISKTLDGIIATWNPGAEKMFGYSADEIIGKPMTILFPDDRLDEEAEVLRKIAQGTKVEYFETLRTRKDGTPIRISATISPVVDSNGVIIGASKIARDITEHADLHDELKILAIAFESDDGILITDKDSRIVRVNRAFTKITGYAKEEALGKKPSLLKSGRHDDNFYRAMYEKLHSEGFWRGEIWDRHKDGHIYPKLTTITAVKNDNGEIINYIATFSDITERVEAELKIKNLAFYDTLTALPNRRLMMDRLKHKLLAEARRPDYGALLFIDLDNFKTLNDTRGHDIGDQLLQETAKRLQACVREADTVSRFGGDEFVIMLEALGEQRELAATRAGAVGNKILAALSQPYQLAGCEHIGSSSIGIALFGNLPVAMDELLRRADMAMYEAKKAGRNALRFFDPAMQHLLEHQAELESDLRKALKNQEFRLYYQLQTDDQSAPIGVEALLRWNHPRQGVINPDQFIALAEETGLIVPIGLWVLETACAQIKAWENDAKARGLRVSVNVSARQFYQPDFSEQVESLIKRFGINPARLMLELTESVVVRDIMDTLKKMEYLNGIGISFAMDDFGTGYSSLSQIKRLPFQELKIDQSFVRDILADSGSMAIVDAIIGMGRAMGIKVIAEGVETEEQKKLLAEHGCDALQGYFISRPENLAKLGVRLALTS